MKIKPTLIALIGIATFFGCHKDSPARKIVDGLPVSSAPLTIVPAQAVQQFLLLKNVMLGPVVTNLNRLAIAYPSTGLTGPNGSDYTFQRTEKHFGLATFTIQFQDSGHGAVDPFIAVASTGVVKYVHITMTGNSSEFAISEDLSLTLQTAGVLTGPFGLTGTSSFNGSSYSINFTIPDPGVNATISGLISGPASSVGTGPTQPTSSKLTFGTSSDLSGVLEWDGQTAGIHVDANGSGYLTTSDSRLLFQ
jgi:hypothetical protein